MPQSTSFQRLPRDKQQPDEPSRRRFDIPCLCLLFNGQEWCVFSDKFEDPISRDDANPICARRRCTCCRYGRPWSRAGSEDRRLRTLSAATINTGSIKMLLSRNTAFILDWTLYFMDLASYYRLDAALGMTLRTLLAMCFTIYLGLVGSTMYRATGTFRGLRWRTCLCVGRATAGGGDTCRVPLLRPADVMYRVYGGCQCHGPRPWWDQRR